MTLSQARAQALYLPLIETKGNTYEKFAMVEVRPAKLGERIVTITADGKETENTAKEGDVVVRNGTGARELYLLSKEKLEKRYTRVGHSKSTTWEANTWSSTPPPDAKAEIWELYTATGTCMAVVYDGPELSFIASWDEPMILRPGDMLCTPLPDKGEVYRIALKEFGETYRRKVT